MRFCKLSLNFISRTNCLTKNRSYYLLIYTFCPWSNETPDDEVFTVPTNSSNSTLFLLSRNSIVFCSNLINWLDFFKLLDIVVKSNLILIFLNSFFNKLFSSGSRPTIAHPVQKWLWELTGGGGSFVRPLDTCFMHNWRFVTPTARISLTLQLTVGRRQFRLTGHYHVSTLHRFVRRTAIRLEATLGKNMQQAAMKGWRK